MSIRRTASLAIAFALAVGPSLALPALAAAPAIDDEYVVNEDETLTVEAPGVLLNDEPDAASVCVVGIDVGGLEGLILDAGNTGWRTDGWFTYTPWSDWNGETSFVYGMKSIEGSQCIGPALGQARVKLTVRPVNDPPTAVVAGSCADGVTVAENSGTYKDPSHCVENHNWGPDDEITQQLREWVVTTNHPELFSGRPSISIVEDTFGELHFTPAEGAHGVATVTVRSRDDGGTARGGDDLSPAISFEIRIKATPEPTAEPTAEPALPTELPTVEPSPTAEVTSVPSESAAPTSPPEGTPTSAPGGDGPVGLLVLLVALAVVAGIAGPRLIRRGRAAS